MRNKYRIEGNKVYIQLDLRFSIEETIISIEDLPKLIHFDVKWKLKKKRNSVYVVTHILRNDKWATIALHRFLLDAPEGYEVDHLDGNGLNNQRDNIYVSHRYRTKPKPRQM